MKLHAAAVESVHLDVFPEPEALALGITAAQRGETADWDRLLEVRNAVLKTLDTAREGKVIGSSLEAAVFLEAGEDIYPVLKRHEAELPGWFIVSEVEVKQGVLPGFNVRFDRARGDKCERCWKYTLDVGSDSNFPTVSQHVPRCCGTSWDSVERHVARHVARQPGIFARIMPLVFTLLVIIGDRLSKLFIQHNMSGFDTVPVIPGWLRIIHTENPGAAFGMLAEGNPFLRSAVLIGVSALVLIFVAGSGGRGPFSAPLAR